MTEPYILFFLGVMATAAGFALKLLFKQMVRLEHRLTRIETLLQTADTEQIRKIRRVV